MCEENGLAFLHVHHDTVRTITAKNYPKALVDDWAPLSIELQQTKDFERI